MVNRRSCRMTSDEIKEALEKKLTVEIWPTAGSAIGVSRNSAYEAVRRGDIPVIQIGRTKRVTTAWLRERLGLEHKRA
jgi:hypothetical protein